MKQLAQNILAALTGTRAKIALMAAFAFVLQCYSAMAAAAVDAGIQEAADSFNLTFTLVKGIAITVLIFAVAYKVGKKWLGK